MKDKESEMFEQQRENSFNNGIIDWRRMNWWRMFK
jgi:hypothetical protein